MAPSSGKIFHGILLRSQLMMMEAEYATADAKHQEGFYTRQHGFIRLNRELAQAVLKRTAEKRRKPMYDPDNVLKYGHWFELIVQEGNLVESTHDYYIITSIWPLPWPLFSVVSYSAPISRIHTEIARGSGTLTSIKKFNGIVAAVEENTLLIWNDDFGIVPFFAANPAEIEKFLLMEPVLCSGLTAPELRWTCIAITSLQRAIFSPTVSQAKFDEQAQIEYKAGILIAHCQNGDRVLMLDSRRRPLSTSSAPFTDKETIALMYYQIETAHGSLYVSLGSLSQTTQTRVYDFFRPAFADMRRIKFIDYHLFMEQEVESNFEKIAPAETHFVELYAGLKNYFSEAWNPESGESTAVFQAVNPERGIAIPTTLNETISSTQPAPMLPAETSRPHLSQLVERNSIPTSNQAAEVCESLNSSKPSSPPPEHPFSSAHSTKRNTPEPKQPVDRDLLCDKKNGFASKFSLQRPSSPALPTLLAPGPFCPHVPRPAENCESTAIFAERFAQRNRLMSFTASSPSPSPSLPVPSSSPSASLSNAKHNSASRNPTSPHFIFNEKPAASQAQTTQKVDAEDRTEVAHANALARRENSPLDSSLSNSTLPEFSPETINAQLEYIEERRNTDSDEAEQDERAEEKKQVVVRAMSNKAIRRKINEFDPDFERNFVKLCWCKSKLKLNEYLKTAFTERQRLRIKELFNANDFVRLQYICELYLFEKLSFLTRQSSNDGRLLCTILASNLSEEDVSLISSAVIEMD